MGWKQKGADYAPTIDWDEQDTFEGVLLGSREVNTQYGGRNMYRFRDMEGEVVEVWGTARLDRCFEDIEEGTRVLIEYKGKVKVKGGNRVHDFEVSVWEEDDGEAESEKPKPAKKAASAKKAAPKKEAAAKPELDEEPY